MIDNNEAGASRCPDIGALVDLAAAIGNAPPEARAHVEACPVCREHLALLGLLQAAVLRKEEAPAHLTAGILEAFSNATDPEPRFITQPWPQATVTGILAGITAALVLIMNPPPATEGGGGGSLGLIVALSLIVAIIAPFVERRYLPVRIYPEVGPE